VAKILASGRGADPGRRGRGRRPADTLLQPRRGGDHGSARADGIYAPHQPPGGLGATKVLRLHKDQSQVEPRHRNLESTLKVRPIFLHNDDRIAALVSVIGWRC
jgi:hypothetical protein